MIDDIAVTWTICWFNIGICRARINSLYNFTLFLVFWLVHAVSWGLPPRKSIDYLLKAVSGWQHVLTLASLPAIFFSRFYQGVMCHWFIKGFRPVTAHWEIKRIIILELSLADDVAAHPSEQGSFRARAGPMGDCDTLIPWTPVVRIHVGSGPWSTAT